MTDHNREEREALIEEAAKAIQDAWSIRTMRPVEERPGLAETAAFAALAVFEQAHTPTDDEQFAKSFGGWTPDEVARNPRAAAEVIERLRSRVIDGFRRTAQGEPPTCQGCFEDDEREEWMATLEALLAEVYTILKPHAETGTHATSSPILKAYGLLNAQEFTRRTVQGEPSDAQVLAALNAHYRVRLAQSEPMPGDPEVQGDAHSLEEYSSKSIDRMRAALRAATQEGEER